MFCSFVFDKAFLFMRVTFFILFITLLVSHSPSSFHKEKEVKTTNYKADIPLAPSAITRTLYNQMGLIKYLKYEAFEEALQGYKKLNPTRQNILTIIDYSLPSTEKRMVILDMENKKVLQHTIVSHGRASGEKFATSFSNKHESHQSSLGFFITENTYFGSNGYSLILNGLEKGINDQAKARAIVIHGADYANESIIKSTGRLGRSYGCPALPRHLNKTIIDTIKNGSLIYIYAQNTEYMKYTKIVERKPDNFLANKEITEESRTRLN